MVPLSELRVDGLCKRYRRRQVLRDVSFQLHSGEVLGIVGPNGSGKTTLMRILAGAVLPTSGTVFEGAPEQRQPGWLGYMPEHPGFIEHLTGSSNLDLLGRLSSRRSREELVALLRRVGLDPANRRAVKTYSLGMRQRLNVAQAIMDDPDVLLLDEPTNGLDAMGLAWLRTVVEGQAARGAAVLLSSHQLSEVESLCRRALIIREGAVVSSWSASSTERTIVKVRLGSARQWDAFIDGAAGDVVKTLDPTSRVVEASVAPPELVRSIVALGLDLEELTPWTANLTDALFRVAEVER